VRWTENQLNCETQKVVISTMNLNFRLFTSGVYQGSIPRLMTRTTGQSVPLVSLQVMKNSFRRLRVSFNKKLNISQ